MLPVLATERFLTSDTPPDLPVSADTHIPVRGQARLARKRQRDAEPPDDGYLPGSSADPRIAAARFHVEARQSLQAYRLLLEVQEDVAEPFADDYYWLLGKAQLALGLRTEAGDRHPSGSGQATD